MRAGYRRQRNDFAYTANTVGRAQEGPAAVDCTQHHRIVTRDRGAAVTAPGDDPGGREGG